MNHLVKQLIPWVWCWLPWACLYVNGCEYKPFSQCPSSPPPNIHTTGEKTQNPGISPIGDSDNQLKQKLFERSEDH